MNTTEQRLVRALETRAAEVDASTFHPAPSLRHAPARRIVHPGWTLAAVAAVVVAIVAAPTVLPDGTSEEAPPASSPDAFPPPKDVQDRIFGIYISSASMRLPALPLTGSASEAPMAVGGGLCVVWDHPETLAAQEGDLGHSVDTSSCSSGVAVQPRAGYEVGDVPFAVSSAGVNLGRCEVASRREGTSSHELDFTATRFVCASGGLAEWVFREEVLWSVGDMDQARHMATEARPLTSSAR